MHLMLVNTTYEINAIRSKRDRLEYSGRLQYMLLSMGRFPPNQQEQSELICTIYQMNFRDIYIIILENTNSSHQHMELLPNRSQCNKTSQQQKLQRLYKYTDSEQ